jgi:hypothetical protein
MSRRSKNTNNSYTIDKSIKISDKIQEKLFGKDVDISDGNINLNGLDTNHNKTFTNLLFILVIYFFLTLFINYKNIFTSFERVFINDFKDLTYWLRFTLGSWVIVYTVMYFVGIDLKKSIEEDNKSAVIVAVALLAITYLFGQKMFV